MNRPSTRPRTTRQARGLQREGVPNLSLVTGVKTMTAVEGGGMARESLRRGKSMFVHPKRSMYSAVLIPLQPPSPQRGGG